MDETQGGMTPIARNTLYYSIIIPAFNESANIVDSVPELAEALRAESIPFELVIVNDNNTDDTAAGNDDIRCPENRQSAPDEQHHERD